MSEHMTTDEFKRAAKKSAKSKLEDKFLAAFAAAKPDGVPMPEREYRFHGTRKWRFDFAFPQPAVKVAVEIHGGSFVNGGHNRPGQQAKDFEKLNTAIECGWRVVQFNTVQLKDPAACAAVVVDVIASLGERIEPLPQAAT